MIPTAQSTSPKTKAALQGRPADNSGQKKSNVALVTSPPNVPRTIPPTAPSMLLFGLISGASLWRPQERPAK